MSLSIVNYKPLFKGDFRDLNYQWISKYFEMEESDKKMLENPQEYILNDGGAILIALYNELPVGTCALIRLNHQVFELAKMAVVPNMQGKQIGFKLGEAAINKAKEMRALKLYLETNSVLKPALALYKKLGFQEVTGTSSPYHRCNVQMELQL
ncbi:MAG: GNAT family N-acetyltransferase [Bacteroidota bacterium]